MNQAPLLRSKLPLAFLLGACLAACTPSDSGASGASGTASAQAALSSDEPRHVLLIVIDTLRADHLGSYGYWRDTSPHMDDLAARGVRFERAIAQSSWTAPSMITMMTGQRLSSRRFTLPEDKPALAELFKDAGFRTGAFVTNMLLCPENGFNRGFDHWELGEEGLKELDSVQRWLEERRDEDTFTWVHFTDPHDPYKPPPAVRTKEMGRLPDSTLELMRNAVEHEGFDGYEQQRVFMANEMGRYDDEIVSVDRKVQALIETLERIGRLDNSLVVITSDHGECLWQRNEAPVQVAHQATLRMEKLGPKAKTRLKHRLKQTHGTLLFQELVRVPLIIMAPGLESGSVREDVAESVHLARTMLALAGVQVEGLEELGGLSLFDSELPAGGYSMTDQGESFVGADGWKLIVPTAMGRGYGIETQLYNLAEDPAELHNLAASEPARVLALQGQIAARRALALPPESGETREQVMRRNAKLLEGLGYTKGGFLDSIELPDEPEGAPAGK